MRCIFTNRTIIWNRMLFYWYQSYRWYQWRPFLSPLTPMESIFEYWTTLSRVLSKGDRVKSEYSEVKFAQFILNCRLFKEEGYVRRAHVVFNFIHEHSYVL